jgi:hypothetical protein
LSSGEVSEKHVTDLQLITMQNTYLLIFYISDFNSSAESKILICFMLAEWEAFDAKNEGG